MIHALKILPEFFSFKIKGLKPFEIRKNDRPYKVGDYLAENEYNSSTDEYTGNAVLERITYIIDDEKYCKPGYIVLGTRIVRIDNNEFPFRNAEMSKIKITRSLEGAENE